MSTSLFNDIGFAIAFRFFPNISPYTYYVEDREYSREEVLRILNPDYILYHNTKHSLLSGEGAFYSGGNFFENAYRSIVLSTIVFPLKSAIPNLIASFLGMFISSKIFDYKVSDIPYELYSGREIVTLLNKQPYFSPWKSSNVVYSFLMKTLSEEDIMPVINDASLLFGPKAVLKTHRYDGPPIVGDRQDINHNEYAIHEQRTPSGELSSNHDNHGNIDSQQQVSRVQGKQHNKQHKEFKSVKSQYSTIDVEPRKQIVQNLKIINKEDNSDFIDVNQQGVFVSKGNGEHFIINKDFIGKEQEMKAIIMYFVFKGPNHNVIDLSDFCEISSINDLNFSYPKKIIGSKKGVDIQSHGEEYIVSVVADNEVLFTENNFIFGECYSHNEL